MILVLMLCSIMEREKKLSILYQKQGRATQFSSKAARDKWLQKEIKDLNVVLTSNVDQVSILIDLFQKFILSSFLDLLATESQPVC